MTILERVNSVAGHLRLSIILRERDETDSATLLYETCGSACVRLLAVEADTRLPDPVHRHLNRATKLLLDVDLSWQNTSKHLALAQRALNRLEMAIDHLEKPPVNEPVTIRLLDPQEDS
jgi:hypothetical protein